MNQPNLNKVMTENLTSESHIELSCEKCKSKFDLEYTIKGRMVLIGCRKCGAVSKLSVIIFTNLP